MVEKRTHPRSAIELQVNCHRLSGEDFAGRSTDLSMGGMYVESNEHVTFGDQLKLEFTPPGARKSLILPAVVRWTDPGGFGVQFGLLGARETHAISQLIRG